MRKRAFALAVSALLLFGCGAKTEMPDDQPYNHGQFNIMETEDGYYTNNIYGNGNHLALRFYERDTENQVFLCAKPECTHDGGESCAATYKDLECLSSILYDGAIYNLTIEGGDTVSLCLYKAALDGTSFTKVGDAFTVANSAGESKVDYLGYLMIHKGYAYISYRISLGESSFGFAGSGLVKMDISNGKCEQLYSGENYFSAYAQALTGSGDYVYYTMYGKPEETGFYRYDTKTGELEKYWDMFPVVGERKFFVVGYDDEDMKTTAVYSCGKEKADIEKAAEDGLDLVAGGFEEQIGQIISYEDRVIISHGTMISVFSEEGELLGEISGADENSGETLIFEQLSVSNGKLYLFDYALDLFPNEYKHEAESGGYYMDYGEVVYSCPIDDIIAGKGEWKFEYGVKDIFGVDHWKVRDYFD